ncbi:hypothetical protein QE152_g38598 [Popillia japonica]|uniref:Uncharacterized protein n=1 Tax=Popillia japonica TaxID=7064 RepID=A0AAW1HVZ6_POPJA
MHFATRIDHVGQTLLVLLCPPTTALQFGRLNYLGIRRTPVRSFKLFGDSPVPKRVSPLQSTPPAAKLANNDKSIPDVNRIEYKLPRGIRRICQIRSPAALVCFPALPKVRLVPRNFFRTMYKACNLKYQEKTVSMPRREAPALGLLKKI